MTNKQLERLSTVVYAYANARVHAPVLLDRVAEAATAKVQFFDDRNLARLMLAFEASHSVSFKRCADALPSLSFLVGAAADLTDRLLDRFCLNPSIDDDK
jgi:hypothetical protein